MSQQRSNYAAVLPGHLPDDRPFWTVAEAMEIAAKQPYPGGIDDPQVEVWVYFMNTRKANLEKRRGAARYRPAGSAC